MTREELLKLEYYGRVERAVDYLYAHYSEDIGLADLADVAGFSRFHFHRIFSGIVGETVGEFLKRIRLQNAASRLFDHPEESVTEVALAVGFSSASVFARAFRERFGQACHSAGLGEGAEPVMVETALDLWRQIPELLAERENRRRRVRGMRRDLETFEEAVSAMVRAACTQFWLAVKALITVAAPPSQSIDTTVTITPAP